MLSLHGFSLSTPNKPNGQHNSLKHDALHTEFIPRRLNSSEFRRIYSLYSRLNKKNADTTTPDLNFPLYNNDFLIPNFILAPNFIRPMVTNCFIHLS